MENRRGLLSYLKSGYRRRFKEEKISEPFLENGSLLLKELIASSNGRYGIPIRNFSFEDLLMATNNFDEHHAVFKGVYYILFKGSLEGRLVFIKKFGKYYTSRAIRDIAVTAQMSIHRNVLKLLGCCLEDEAVALVYEYAGEKFLSDFVYNGEGRDGHDKTSFLWKCRLRAANDIASVLAYLHTALQRPVVHRNVKPNNFIIDQHGVVKLYDFSISVSIPLGESCVEERPAGTWGFLDPEYVTLGFVTEKCDVYSFGMLLLTLLTGEKPLRKNHDEYVLIVPKVQSYVENGQFDEIVDPRIQGEGGGTEQVLQLQAFAGLALRCTQGCGDDRPEMIEVAKELRRIEKSILPLTSSANENQSRNDE